MTSRAKSTPRIRAVDLFCGVGGLTHGLVRGGIDVKAGIDLDPSCKYPFEANNRARFVEKDVNEVTADDLLPYFSGGEYTLLAGCAPCQPFSSYSQGDRRKKRESDWKLVSNFGKLVEEIQPDLVTMENVSQLASHSIFPKFIKSLRGYHVRWSVVECSLLGVPQSRKRLVLLASKLGADGLEIDLTAHPAQTVRQTISSLPEIEAGGQGLGDPLHISPRLSQTNMSRIRASTPGGTWRDWDPDLQAACHKKESGSNYISVYGRMEWDKVAPTITTQCFGYGNGRFGHPVQDRAISLREAAMLQTFPQSYKFVKPGETVRFNRLGRLIGNAVPVRLGEVIANTLVRHVKMSSGS